MKYKDVQWHTETCPFTWSTRVSAFGAFGAKMIKGVAVIPHAILHSLTLSFKCLAGSSVGLIDHFNLSETALVACPSTLFSRYTPFDHPPHRRVYSPQQTTARKLPALIVLRMGLSLLPATVTVEYGCTATPAQWNSHRLPYIMSLRATVQEALAVRGFCGKGDSLLRLALLMGTSVGRYVGTSEPIYRVKYAVGI